MGRERAVLAVAAAGPRQRQREVAAERDAAAHAPGRFYGAARPSARDAPPCGRRARSSPAARLRRSLAGCGTGGSSAPQGQDVPWSSTSPPMRSMPASTRAMARTFDDRRGCACMCRAPRRRPTRSSCSARRLDFAILDIHDLAIARERGVDHRRDHGRRPAPAGGGDRAPGDPDRRAQLDGRTVGITGVPSDTAVLDSIVAGRRRRARAGSAP